MTTDQMRIAVAESLGWKRSENGLTWISPSGSLYARFKERGCDSVSINDSQILPNFPADLNAMHEAEKTLNGSKDDEYSELSGYQEQLCLVCGDGMEPLNVYEIDVIRATAAQRCEAYLRVKGLWKEDAK